MVNTPLLVLQVLQVCQLLLGIVTGGTQFSNIDDADFYLPHEQRGNAPGSLTDPFSPENFHLEDSTNTDKYVASPPPSPPGLNRQNRELPSETNYKTVTTSSDVDKTVESGDTYNGVKSSNGMNRSEGSDDNSTDGEYTKLVMPAEYTRKGDTTDPGCRYSDTAWGDCDPISMARSKKVSLAPHSLNRTECAAVREFSQGCTEQDLPKGTKTLLAAQKLCQQRDTDHKKILLKMKTFMEETKKKLLKIQHLNKNEENKLKASYSDRKQENTSALKENSMNSNYQEQKQEEYYNQNEKPSGKEELKSQLEQQLLEAKENHRVELEEMRLRLEEAEARHKQELEDTEARHRQELTAGWQGGPRDPTADSTCTAKLEGIPEKLEIVRKSLEGVLVRYNDMRQACNSAGSNSTYPVNSGDLSAIIQEENRKLQGEMTRHRLALTKCVQNMAGQTSYGPSRKALAEAESKHQLEIAQIKAQHEAELARAGKDRGNLGKKASQLEQKIKSVRSNLERFLVEYTERQEAAIEERRKLQAELKSCKDTTVRSTEEKVEDRTRFCAKLGDSNVTLIIYPEKIKKIRKGIEEFLIKYQLSTKETQDELNRLNTKIQQCESKQGDEEVTERSDLDLGQLCLEREKYDEPSVDNEETDVEVDGDSPGDVIGLILDAKVKLENLQGAEIQIFNSLLEKLRGVLSETTDKTKKLQRRLRVQDSYIYLLELEKKRTGSELSGLKERIAKLRDSKHKLEDQFRPIKSSIVELRRDLESLVYNFHLIKRNYVKNSELHNCLDDLRGLKTTQSNLQPYINQTRQLVETLRKDTVEKLVSRVRQVQATAWENRLKATQLERVVRTQEDSLAGLTHQIFTFLTDFKKMIDDNSGLATSYITLTPEQDYSRDMVKTQLDEARRDLKSVLQSIQAKESAWNHQLITCTRNLKDEEARLDYTAPILAKIKSSLFSLQKGDLHSLIKIKKTHARLLDYEMMKNKEYSKALVDLKSSRTWLTGQLRDFLSEFIQVSAFYTGVPSKVVLPPGEAGGSGESVDKQLGLQLTASLQEIKSVFSQYKARLNIEKQRLIRIRDELQIFKEKLRIEGDCKTQLNTSKVKEEDLRQHLRREQIHTYKCHVRYFKDKKVLKDVEDFNSYLLQRLNRLNEGIHELRVVGNKLRDNLVTAHSTMGNCTGNLQALRHECQGLVNWYQTQPNLEILKRRLDSCLQEKKHNFKVEETPAFLLDHIKEQKEKIAKVSHEELICEKKLQDSMRQLIDITKTMHNSKNTGYLSDENEEQGRTEKEQEKLEKERTMNLLIQAVKEDQEKVQRVNKILYDSLLSENSSSSIDIISHWNMSSLDSTQQALSVVLKPSGNTDIKDESGREEGDLKKQFEHSKAMIEEVVKSLIHLSSYKSEKYRTILGTVEGALKSLREKELDVVQELSQCREEKEKSQEREKIKPDSSSVPTGEKPDLAYKEDVYKKENLGEDLKNQEDGEEDTTEDENVEEDTGEDENIEDGDVGGGDKEDVLAPYPVKYEVDSEAEAGRASPGLRLEGLTRTDREWKTNSLSSNPAKPFNIEKIQGLINKTENISSLDVDGEGSIHSNGLVDSDAVNNSLTTVEAELKSLKAKLQEKMVNNTVDTTTEMPVMGLPTFLTTSGPNLLPSKSQLTSFSNDLNSMTPASNTGLPSPSNRTLLSGHTGSPPNGTTLAPTNRVPASSSGTPALTNTSGGGQPPARGDLPPARGDLSTSSGTMSPAAASPAGNSTLSAPSSEGSPAPAASPPQNALPAAAGLDSIADDGVNIDKIRKILDRTKDIQ